MAKRKIGFLADTHIGYNGYASLHNEFGELRTEKQINGVNVRTLDVNKTFSQAIDIFIEEGVELVGHSGDGMNFWGYKYPSISNFYLEEIKRLTDNGIFYVEIAGNHNFAKKISVGCELQKLNLLNNAVGIYKGLYEKHDIPGTNMVVHGLPDSFDKESFQEQISCVKRVEGKFNILLAHCGVTSIEFYAKSESSKAVHLEQLRNLGMDLIILGDYHQFVDFGDHIYYPGATERFSINEANEKPRVLIFTIDDETKEISMEMRFLDPRPMLDLPVIDAQDKKLVQIQEEIIQTLKSHPIDDAIVRLQVKNLPKSMKHRHLFLTDEFIELQNKCLIFKLDLKNKIELSKSIQTRNDIEFVSVLEGFEGFVKKLPENPDIPKDRVFDIGMKYLREAMGDETA